VEAFSSGAISGFLFAANSSIASSDIFCSIQTFLDVVSFPSIIFLDCFVFVFIDPNASVKGATMRCHAGLIHSVDISKPEVLLVGIPSSHRIIFLFCFVLVFSYTERFCQRSEDAMSCKDSSKSVAPGGPSMPPPIKKETWVAGKQEGQAGSPSYRQLEALGMVVG
jgi:hypothetical protein